MKFRCPKEVWLRGVTAVQNAVGSPISNPMVENILVSCKDNTVSFMATNLSLTIRCCREAEIDEEGDIALPTKVITGLVRDFPSGEVSFASEDTNVEITCGGFEGKLKGQPGEQFPPFLPVEEGEQVRVPATVLREAIRRTILATSTEKSRFELDGIKFDVNAKTAFFVATDGRRLAQVTYGNDDLPEGPLSSLIPSKTMSELLNSLPEEGDVTVLLSERRAMFSCGDLTVASNLLTDKFPPYDRIIPRDGRYQLIADRVPFLEAVKRVSDLTSLETNLLILELSENNIKLLGERAEVGGRAEEDIEVEYDGEPMNLRYNYRFLMDVLRLLTEDRITLELWDEGRPGVFRGQDREDFLYVLMPMKPPEDETGQNTTAE